MKIIESGSELEVPSGCTVEKLLAILGEDGRHDMIVEINHVFVHAKDYSCAQIREGDQIELIHLAFGG
ncbi:MAG: sulfur carrier protein ThiS [Syntrophobacteraceae bacterium]|nr:sulfur carrier protein ThiS [Syntrophobacteraceae bacterium]